MPCDSISSGVTLVVSCWEYPQAVLAGSQVTSGTHAGIYLRPSDISCQYSRSIYTACFIVWQPRRAADTLTNWRQSLFCCCTMSVEQATNGAETAAIDGLVSLWSENIFVSFCLRARYGLTLWCALGLLVGAQYKCLSYSYIFVADIGLSSTTLT